MPIEQKRADMSALKLIIRLIKEGRATAIFPEGTRTSDGQLQRAQPGLGLMVAKTLAPVVPIRICGAFEAYPRTRKLPRSHPITVVVGQPIYFTAQEVEQGGKEVYQQISDRVMAAIAELSPE